jgi:hypothetical protein
VDLGGQFDAVVKNAVGLTQQQIAVAAVKANARVMETPPHPLAVTVHVDGVKDAPETSVKAGGVIVYDYARMDLVAEFALDTLRQLSPVDSGAYVRSHVLMLNGQVVESLQAWKPGDTITISNTQPYTRKIEIGKKGFKARGSVYEKAERIISRRFDNMANVYFAYRQAPPGAIHDWAAKTKLHRYGSRAKRAEWLTNQPTLVIRERS